MTTEPHDPLWDPSAEPADADLVRLEAALAPLRHRAPLRDLPPRRRSRAPWIAAGAAVVAAAAALLFYMWFRKEPEAVPTPEVATGFHYEESDGETGVLAVGDVLATDDQTRARVQVADIGTIDLAESSLLSLIETGPKEHRLDLRHGKLHAKVNAPPRLFVIQTPSATAVDLGCEYDLQVEPDGEGLLRVTNGKVELATGEQVVIVTMNAMARIHPGSGPGTPAMQDAPPALLDAIDLFDARRAGGLDAVLAHAARRDTITLWHILMRRDLDATTRARVADALAAVFPLPPWIERDRLAAGDFDHIEVLREYLEQYWYYPEVLGDR